MYLSESFILKNLLIFQINKVSGLISDDMYHDVCCLFSMPGDIPEELLVENVLP